MSNQARDAKAARRVQRALEGDVIEPVRYQTCLNAVRNYVREHPINCPVGEYWPQVVERVTAELRAGYTARDGQADIQAEAAP